MATEIVPTVAVACCSAVSFPRWILTNELHQDPLQVDAKFGLQVPSFQLSGGVYMIFKLKWKVCIYYPYDKQLMTITKAPSPYH